MIDKILIFLRLFLYLQDVRKTEIIHTHIAGVDILTGQFGNIHQTPATIGDCMLAHIIDIIVQTVYVIASTMLFMYLVPSSARGWAHFAFCLYACCHR